MKATCDSCHREVDASEPMFQRTEPGSDPNNPKFLAICATCYGKGAKSAKSDRKT